MRILRRYLIAGIVTILPIGLTIFLLWFLISRFGSLLSPLLSLLPFLSHLPQPLLSLLGFFAFLIFILLVGALTSNFLGRWLLTFLEDILSGLPIVKSIYTSAKKLTETVFVDKKTLKKMVLVEYPRKDLYTLGFLILEEELFLPDGKPYLLVFLPATPNPTTGWLVIAPKGEVKELKIPVEEGIKIIVSGGIVLSEETKKKLTE
uniref:DUF502 domain-containing protein n=1 Tax=candidate division WOR-3 bacterium TaxID=2052148 RepID=A0A7C3Z2P5_UNCW3